MNAHALLQLYPAVLPMNFFSPLFLCVASPHPFSLQLVSFFIEADVASDGAGEIMVNVVTRSFHSYLDIFFVCQV